MTSVYHLNWDQINFYNLGCILSRQINNLSYSCGFMHTKARMQTTCEWKGCTKAEQILKCTLSPVPKMSQHDELLYFQPELCE